MAWIVSGGSLGALLGLSVNHRDLTMLLAPLLRVIYTILSQRVLRTQSPLATTTITSLLALPLLVLIGGYELITHQDHPRHGPRPTLRRYHGFDRGFPLLERRDRADRT